jgi:predicted HTH transcriptional regulator
MEDGRWKMPPSTFYHPFSCSRQEQCQLSGKTMDKKKLLKEIQSGEDSTRQFKVDVKNADSLASEMVAFSNSQGGTIFIGIDDNGKIVSACQPKMSSVSTSLSAMPHRSICAA